MATRRPQPNWLPILVAIVAAGVFLYVLRGILVPFVVGTWLAYIASPLVDWLRRRLNLNRFLVVLLLFIVILGPLVGLGF